VDNDYKKPSVPCIQCDFKCNPQPISYRLTLYLGRISSGTDNAVHRYAVTGNDRSSQGPTFILQATHSELPHLRNDKRSATTCSGPTSLPFAGNFTEGLNHPEISTPTLTVKLAPCSPTSHANIKLHVHGYCFADRASQYISTVKPTWRHFLLNLLIFKR
jgi:hypothetical protein